MWTLAVLAYDGDRAQHEVAQPHWRVGAAPGRWDEMSSRRRALDLISHSPEQTRSFGARLGRLARPGDVYLLRGPLGSGKTALTQGIARGLGVEGYVQSPTFTLAAEHPARSADGSGVTLYHLDLYRLESPGEVETFGYDEYLDDPHGIVVIEWPERAEAAMPEAFMLIELEHLADAKRRLVLEPHGERYVTLVEELRAEVVGVRRGTAPAGD